MSIVDADHPPRERNLVFSWERGHDPFHRDAFPPELQAQIQNTGPREQGWYGLDWVGNVILFIADGTEEKDAP